MGCRRFGAGEARAGEVGAGEASGISPGAGWADAKWWTGTGTRWRV